MNDLDALERNWRPGVLTRPGWQQMMDLIAELRASRKVVEAARRDRMHGEEGPEVALALAELEPDEFDPDALDRELRASATPEELAQDDLHLGWEYRLRSANVTEPRRIALLERVREIAAEFFNLAENDWPETTYEHEIQARMATALAELELLK